MSDDDLIRQKAEAMLSGDEQYGLSLSLSWIEAAREVAQAYLDLLAREQQTREREADLRAKLHKHIGELAEALGREQQTREALEAMTKRAREIESWASEAMQIAKSHYEEGRIHTAQSILAAGRQEANE